MASNASDIFSRLSPLPEIKAASVDELKPHMDARRPFVVRGLVSDWPLVKRGLESGGTARNYLLEKAVDRPFVVTMGSDEFDGRIFYRDDMSMNTKTGKAKLPMVFDRINENEDLEKLPILYLSSISMKDFFTDLHKENSAGLDVENLMERIWMGTPTRISAHNDFYENLACVSVGRRRFCIFPPEEFKNLYIGPIDNTPAGRAISMVDFHKPDWDRFPLFEQAIEAGLTATLEPGDAIFIPSMWWHHVEGLDPFNVLINYWWRETPRYMGGPQNALNHAMMAIRDLPDFEKEHWKDLFDHYVFNNDPIVTDHIPEGGRGVLGPMTAEKASTIRTYLIKMLSNE